MHTVYCISSIKTGFFYLNAAESFKDCVSMHKKMLSKGEHPIKDLQKIYKQHGWEDLIFKIIEDNVPNDRRESVVLAYRAAFTARN